MTYGKDLNITLLALADPTRREIINRLRHGELAVGEIAAGMSISRPAVSQHLRVLSDAGLLTVTPMGAKRLYRIAPEGTQPLRQYLDELWDDALTAFATKAEEQAKETQ